MNIYKNQTFSLIRASLWYEWIETTENFIGYGLNFPWDCVNVTQVGNQYYVDIFIHVYIFLTLQLNFADAAAGI